MKSPPQICVLFVCAAACWTGIASAQPPLEPLPPPAVAPKPGGPLLPEDRPIGSIGAQIQLKPEHLPPDLSAARFAEQADPCVPRLWEETVYYWDAPAFCHGALRYEEINLERQGYTHFPVLQPAISGAHFFASTLALPYSMTVHPPSECIYPLGHYRPGSPVPYRWQRPETNVKAGGVQAGVVTGLIFLIP